MEPFNTNPFFVGGAGLFLQYFDVVKPVHLYAIMKMIITRDTYGLPVNIIENMRLPSIIEWYKERSTINPLIQLDYLHKIPHEQLDELMTIMLHDDKSIYKLSPLLNIYRLFDVYTKQHMIFPIYVYSEEYNEFIEHDIHSSLQFVNAKYVYGPIEQCLQKYTSENYTYIFSDIELMKIAIDSLPTKYSHVLLTEDYRYNKNHSKFKYDLEDMMKSNFPIRLGTTRAMDFDVISPGFENITNRRVSNATIAGSETG